MSKDEALKLALEALDGLYLPGELDRVNKAFLAINQALAQPKQEPVAFETWWEDHGQFCRAGGGDYEKTFAFRAWEAAIATPPAAAQPEQEPYGWVQPNPSFNSGIFNQGAECPSGWVGSAIAVHTAPPAAQRTWVGLTDAEKKWAKETDWYVDELIEWINTKLKEKNT